MARPTGWASLRSACRRANALIEGDEVVFKTAVADVIRARDVQDARVPRRPRKTRTRSMRMNLREAQAVVSVVTGNRMANPGRYSHLELAGSKLCDRYGPMSRIGQKRTPFPE